MEKIWKEYHDLYLKCDVLLLANVFEKFRSNTLNNYGFCLSHYLSPPGLSWDAMLKITKIDLELFPDPNMHIFFEKGSRSGISYISNRYNKANKKYWKSCDPKQESKHTMYWDANNLSGYAMSKFFPTSGFKWIGPKEFDLHSYTSNSSKGCVLEVDLEYPKELRELLNGYSLAPDKIEIKREMLSEYQLKIADLYNIPIGNVKTLVPNYLIKKSMYFNMKTCNFSNKLVIEKMKDETGGVAVEEFVGLKPKMYSFLVGDNSEHKKSKRCE